jgi:hypothetical protein
VQDRFLISSQTQAMAIAWVSVSLPVRNFPIVSKPPEQTINQQDRLAALITRSGFLS